MDNFNMFRGLREMDSRGNSECYSSAGSSPVLMGSLPQHHQHHEPSDMQHLQLTPPNSPRSPMDNDDEDCYFVTARMSVDDGVPTTGTTSNIGPFIQKLTELIGQLQSLEEAQLQTIKEAADSDNLDKILGHFSASSSSAVTSKKSPSVSLFSKRRRSKDNKQHTPFSSIPPPEEVTRLEQARDRVVEVTRETIVAVRAARKRLGQSLTPPVYANALAITTTSITPSLSSGGGSEGQLDWPYLLGRCFNLSLNIKILQGNQFNDPATAGKCYADLNVLENHLDVHWINVGQKSLVDDLKKEVEARRVAKEQLLNVANNSGRIESSNKSPEKSTLCLKPVRRLLKISPIRL